jgi:hypothetical protein
MIPVLLGHVVEEETTNGAMFIPHLRFGHEEETRARYPEKSGVNSTRVDVSVGVRLAKPFGASAR